ncbi:MAG: hypothetical protein ACO1OB_24655 [Archangium sp.]
MTRALLSGVVGLLLAACPPPGGGGSGGGTGSRGGGTGTTGGGSGSTGGGSGGTAAIGTFPLKSFRTPQLSATSDGSLDMVFYGGLTPDEGVRYGHCTSNCADLASWNTVLIANPDSLNSGTLGVYGLGRDGSGRLHTVIGGSTPNTTVYGTCGSNCGSASSWSFLDLTQAFPDDGWGPRDTMNTLTVTSAGAVGFFSSNGYYLSCASNCGVATSWSSVKAVEGTPLHARLDGSGVTHVAVYVGDSADGSELIGYARCASTCGTASSWTTSGTNGFRSGQFTTTSFDVTATGVVWMALNRGTEAAGDGSLHVFRCASACDSTASWTELVLASANQGTGGTALVAADDGVGLAWASKSETDLNLATCETGCDTTAGWSGVIVDSQADITAAAPFASFADCTVVTGTAWWPRSPVGISTSKGALVVHAPYLNRNCGTAPAAEYTTIGRVFSTF